MAHTDDGDSDESSMPSFLRAHNNDANSVIEAAAFQRKTAQQYSVALDELQCMILRSGVFQSSMLSLSNLTRTSQVRIYDYLSLYYSGVRPRPIPELINALRENFVDAQRAHTYLSKQEAAERAETRSILTKATANLSSAGINFSML